MRPVLIIFHLSLKSQPNYWLWTQWLYLDLQGKCATFNRRQKQLQCIRRASQWHLPPFHHLYINFCCRLCLAANSNGRWSIFCARIVKIAVNESGKRELTEHFLCMENWMSGAKFTVAKENMFMNRNTIHIVFGRKESHIQNYVGNNAAMLLGLDMYWSRMGFTWIRMHQYEPEEVSHALSNRYRLISKSGFSTTESHSLIRSALSKGASYQAVRETGKCIASHAISEFG